MKNYFFVLFASCVLTIIFGVCFIPLLKKLKAGQPILKYVEAHKDKGGTPTMGGLLFLFPSFIIYFTVNGFKNNLANIAALIGASFTFVGFLDDFIKIKYGKNEGLKPYQKIFFQTAIAIFAGVFVYLQGITGFYVPFTKIYVDLSFGAIPVVALIFISITNCVNLTDGLDGLASFTVIPYLIFLVIIISLEIESFGLFSGLDEYVALNTLSLSVVGGVFGFLAFNVNKASVFMGDTGSLGLGGLIGAVSIFSSNGFFIPIIGIMFVVSGISVIVQVVWFKKTGKRVFLMAPLHHHFQLKGKSEAQISYVYFLITVLMGLVSVLFLL